MNEKDTKTLISLYRGLNKHHEDEAEKYLKPLDPNSVPPMPSSLVISDSQQISQLYGSVPTFDGGTSKPKLPSKVTLTSPENPDVKIICHRNSDKELEFGIVHKGLGKGELLKVTIHAEGAEPKVVFLVTEVFASPAEANYSLKGYKETDPKNLQFEIEDGIDVTTLSDAELGTLAESHREVIATFSDYTEIWQRFANDYLQNAPDSSKLKEVLTGILTGQTATEKPQFVSYSKPENSLDMPKMMMDILNRSENDEPTQRTSEPLQSRESNRSENYLGEPALRRG